MSEKLEPSQKSVGIFGALNMSELWEPLCRKSWSCGITFATFSNPCLSFQDPSSEPKKPTFITAKSNGNSKSGSSADGARIGLLANNEESSNV